MTTTQTPTIATPLLPCPFSSHHNERLQGCDGLYSLWYFDRAADAETFAQATGGTVLETTQGTVWRVTRRQDRDLPNYHCWGQRRQPIPIHAPVLKTIGKGTDSSLVTLHAEATQYGTRHWVAYDKASLSPDDAGTICREWCPLSMPVDVATWGTVKYAACRCRAHEHRCSACGHLAFIELHGCADGFCKCCGYHG